MKLLLTSAGLTNQSLRNALQTLVGKPFTECKVVFIPTAANVEAGDKSWLVDNYNECLECNFKEFDIVDVAALSADEVADRLIGTDILFVGGGNTMYLNQQLQRVNILEHINTARTVWVGISAGSMVTTPITKSAHSTFYYEEVPTDDQPGLNLVSFYMLPHYNSEHFTEVRDEVLEPHFSKHTETTYVLDDQSGVLVNEDHVEVISEGKWRKFN